MKDLVLMVADKNMQFALRGALMRPTSLGIREIGFDFRTHPGRDGGVRTSGPAALAHERQRFSHAVVVFDLEGSGASSTDVAEIEAEMDAQLHAHWGPRAISVVIDPEVDVWLWGADNALQEAFRWPLGETIRSWLGAKGYQFTPDGKPRRPKEALEALIPIHRQPRSSALYERITSRISLQKCRDRAFRRLSDQLRAWFPAVDNGRPR